MKHFITYTPTAEEQLLALASNATYAKRFKHVKKALKLLESNPRHPGLNTHKFSSLSREFNREIFEAYAENKTPGAYRIFWYYGDERGEIRVIAITPHP